MIKLLLTALLALLCLTASSQTFRPWGLYGTANYNMTTSFNRYTAGASTVTLNGVQLTGGFQFRPYACLELGVAYLADTKKVFTQIPFTIGLRSHYLMNSKLTPFTEVYIGYSMALKNTGRLNNNNTMRRKDNGGVTAGLNVGGRYSFSRKFAFNFFVGYNLYMANEYTIFDPEKMPVEENSWLAHNFRLGLGVMF